MSTEIWYEEQRRTMILDAAMERYPKCTCCGDPIAESKYLFIFGRNVCKDCIEANMEFNLEVLVDEY